jgi:hypothetical protein
MENLGATIKIAYEAKVNVAFWGRHGIGKTAVIEQLSSDGFYVKTIILSQSDPLVLGGMPRSSDVSKAEAPFVDDGQKSIFATPLWLIDLRKAAAEGKKPIAFLDEFNRADKYAHNAAMRLVNEGEICGHKVPSGTIFVMAMNPETLTDGDINPLNDPLINRMAHIPVYSNMATWLAWAKGEGKINPAVIRFVQADSKRLNGFSMEGLFEEQVLNRLKPTERADTAVSRIIDVVTGGEEAQSHHVKGIVYSLIRGLCGAEWAKEFCADIENSYVKPFTVEEMLNPTKATVAKLTKLKESGQTQVIAASLEVAREKISVMGDKGNGLAVKDLKKFFNFLGACPKDIQSSFWSADLGNTNRNKVTTYWNRMLAQAGPDVMPAELFASLSE